MSTLGDLQTGFMAQVLDEGTPAPDGWGERHATGMQVYRLGYRARLVEALQELYEKTAELTGDAAFRQVAANHLIMHPPSGWTLDGAGEGFASSCAAFFAQDPVVAELAALEWAMHGASIAADAPTLSAAEIGLATVNFGEDEWLSMRLGFAPGCALVASKHDLMHLWNGLGEGARDLVRSREPGYHLVWREDERPTFVSVSLHEGDALSALLQGATYGEAAGMLIDTLGEERGVADAGAMFGRWIALGVISAVRS